MIEENRIYQDKFTGEQIVVSHVGCDTLGGPASRVYIQKLEIFEIPADYFNQTYELARNFFTPNNT